ncbi:MAG: type II toxin-antitoxin system RelB/DinJ family antitoxin [Oscillospiraceae bacterium]|nr:type II toxin-antitoxin system RelB/DinJ family antitoxin [Oscillospiraceae bacterium]
MADLTSLNIKIDRSVKEKADSIANALGMTLSTAINIFVRQMVNEKAIPFRIHLVDNDNKQFHKLLDDMRFTASEHGFMSDDEINAEIQAARAEIKE